MKKKLFLIFCILLVVGILPAALYWRSLLTSAVLSALNARYGLTLNYGKLNFFLFPGRATIMQPRLSLEEDSGFESLAAAEKVLLSLRTQKIFQGKVDVSRVYANRLSIDLIHTPAGGLNWSRALKRVVPKRSESSIAMVQSAGANLPSSSESASTRKPANSAVNMASTTEKNKPSSAPVSKATKTVKASPKSVSASKDMKNATGEPAPASASATLQIPQIPTLDFEDVKLNYYGDAANGEDLYGILMERFFFNPSNKEMNIQNARVTQHSGNEIVLNVQKLNILNAFAPPDQKLELNADTLQLRGRETEKDHYDFSSILSIWLHVYHEIGDSVSGKKPSPSEDRFPWETISVTNLVVQVVPPSGGENDPGAVAIHAESVAYNQSKDTVILKGMKLYEAGHSLLQLNQLVLSGLSTGRSTIEKMVMQGGQLDIREGQTGDLNIARAIQRIQSVFQSLFPRTQTVQTSPFSLDGLRLASLDQGKITWYRSNDTPHQQLVLDSLRFDASVISATHFSMARWDAEKKTIVFAPRIIADVSGTDWHDWSHVQIDDMDLDLDWLPDRFDLVDSASGWLALPKRIRQQLNWPDFPPKPVVIHRLQLANTKIHLMDRTLDPPLSHQMYSMDIQWNDLQLGMDNVPLAPIQLKGRLTEPSDGELTFLGRVAPSGVPVNLVGSATLEVSDLSAYNPYLEASEKSLPVRIVNGGLRVETQVVIRDNQVDGVIDLYLINPLFEPNQSKWLLQLDQKAVITTLNGMKNKQGIIAFPDNEWKGNVLDPQFKRGLGVNDILWENLQTGLRSVLKLPFNLVGTGAGLVKKGVGSVGNAFKKILGGNP